MIGIDLGTTNSLVALLENGQPRVLKNEFGEDLTASAIAVAEDGALLVGRAAKDRLVVAPHSGRAFFKRDMGTAVSFSFGGRRWTPVECSALVLREMKRIAERELGTTVDSAVITVPAYFHDQQRQATVEAAKIAGLRVERLLNEPTAAALAFGYQAKGELSTVMVFDLGGGTFDVTVLECFDGVVEVKASAGESRLGGEDFTDAFSSWIMNEFHWKPPPDEAGRWRERVEMLKRRLTKDERGTIVIGGAEAPISRDDFISATNALAARLRPVVRRALRDAGIAPAQLDAVLMVGGASRMPQLANQLVEDLKIAPDTQLDPDRVVAIGAAIQQALCAGHAAVRELVLTDVCPHTLGVEITKHFGTGKLMPGFFSPILDRNTTVPVSRSETFNTLHPDQDQIDLKVYQGESRLVQDNQFIGHVHVGGLRHRPGQTQPGVVDVRFSYDMNGILEVEVTVLSSGRKLREVFEQRPGTLTREQIEEAIRTMQPLKVHPREQPANRALLERAGRLYLDLSGGMRDQLNQLLDHFEAAMTQQDPGFIRLAAADLDAFMSPFFKEEE